MNTSPAAFVLDDPHRSTELLLLVGAVEVINALLEAALVVDDTVPCVELVSADWLVGENDVDVELSCGVNEPADREIVVPEEVGAVEAAAEIEVEDDVSRKLPNCDDIVDVVEVVDVIDVAEVEDVVNAVNAAELDDAREEEDAVNADNAVELVNVLDVGEAVEVDNAAEMKDAFGVGEAVEVDEVDETARLNDAFDVDDAVEVVEVVDVVRSSEGESSRDSEDELKAKLPDGNKLLVDEDSLDVGDELSVVSS